jgi:large subunit ribosomal protein L25
MAGERITLQVQERERRGSAESRRLRKRGLIPGVLYRAGDEPHPFAVPERDLRRALSGAGGLHTILDVVIDGAGKGKGKPHASILKDYQLDPLRGTLTHIDLHEVRLDQPIQASVVVALIGEPAGVKEGGVLSQVTREVTVEALPMEVPEHIDVDVSDMALGDTLRAEALPPIEGVTYLDDPEETVLATVTAPTRVIEPEEVEEEAEEGVEVEGEEAPEGEAEEPAGGDAAGSPGTPQG